MNRKLWIQKALTMCSLTAIIASFSMVALALPGAVGELTVSGSSLTETAFVTVNGEVATSGRTVSSASTIITPDGMSAIANFGKLGKVQFGPNTTFTLNADNSGLSGDLTAGTITVLSAAKAVGVRMANGETVLVNAGETATAGTAATQTTTQNKNVSNGAWIAFGVILAGAVGAIIWAATTGSDNRFGGGTAVTVSPVR